MATSKNRFQFSNKTAQRAEARKNAQEALALVQAHVPAKAELSPADDNTTTAGACFRRVTAILSRRGQ